MKTWQMCMLLSVCSCDLVYVCGCSQVLGEEPVPWKYLCSCGCKFGIHDVHPGWYTSSELNVIILRKGLYNIKINARQMGCSARVSL